MLTDSHTHLYLEEFDGDASEAVDRAIKAGVTRLMFPNVSLDTIEPMKSLASRYPSHVDMAMGLHPTEVDGDFRAAIDVIEKELREGNYKAVGEIGIDLYWDKTFLEQQKEAFERQCRLAIELDKPVIIHCREGLDEIIEVLKGLEKVPRGVFHSFGGTVEDVERIRQVGDFYFGINGIVTFKNAKVKEVLPTIGIDRLLLETDSPYLAPVPHRGKRNESAFMIHTAAFCANTLGVTTDFLAEKTTGNYHKLFG